MLKFMLSTLLGTTYGLSLYLAAEVRVLFQLTLSVYRPLSLGILWNCLCNCPLLTTPKQHNDRSFSATYLNLFTPTIYSHSLGSGILARAGSRIY